VKPWLRRLAIVWLALGTIIFLHGALTGDGLAGALLYRQLVATHTASPMTVSELLIFPLCVVPLAVLLLTQGPSPAAPPSSIQATQLSPARGFLLGGLFGGAIALSLQPGRDARLRIAALALGAVAVLALATAGWTLMRNYFALDYAAVIDLDTAQPIPPARGARITGTARPSFALSYREDSEVRGTAYGTYHVLLPLTPAGWRPADPVHILADIDGQHLPSGDHIFTMQGALTPKPPGYVRHALRDEGLMLADDLVVLSASPSLGLMSFLLAIGVIALALSVAAALANTQRRA
jgi:hypothetical protein